MRRTLTAGAAVLAAVAMQAAPAMAKDANHDRLPDGWERAYHLSLHVNQANRDQDHESAQPRRVPRRHEPAWRTWSRTPSRPASAASW
jgi:hypothetical protein